MAVNFLKPKNVEKVEFIHTLNLTANDNQVEAVKKSLNDIVSKLDSNDIILLGKLANDGITRTIALAKLREQFKK